MEIANLAFALLLLSVISIQTIHAEDPRKDDKGVTKRPPPGFNPLEDLILNQNKNGFNPGSSLSRVKRQYGRNPYPIPIIIGGFGGIGGYGGGFGRGFGGRGFGGRGFGGRGFGGRGFGGRGFGGGIGGRGIGGGFGGGRGGRG